MVRMMLIALAVEGPEQQEELADAAEILQQRQGFVPMC